MNSKLLKDLTDCATKRIGYPVNVTLYVTLDGVTLNLDEKGFNNFLTLSITNKGELREIHGRYAQYFTPELVDRLVQICID